MSENSPLRLEHQSDPLSSLLDEVKSSVAEQDRRIVPIQSFAKPQHEVQNEKAWHRLVCYRSAAGDTPEEIARMLERSVEAVRNVLNQPRSRELIATIIRDDHEESVAELLRGGAVDAVIALRDVAATGKPMERVAAATQILDRVYGKAAVAKEPGMQSTKRVSPEEEAREIEKQLADLEGKVYEAE